MSRVYPMIPGLHKGSARGPMSSGLRLYSAKRACASVSVSCRSYPCVRLSSWLSTWHLFAGYEVAKRDLVRGHILGSDYLSTKQIEQSFRQPLINASSCI